MMSCPSGLEGEVVERISHVALVTIEACQLAHIHCHIHRLVHTMQNAPSDTARLPAPGVRQVPMMNVVVAAVVAVDVDDRVVWSKQWWFSSIFSCCGLRNAMSFHT